MSKKKNHMAPNDSFTEFLLYTDPNGKVKVEIFLHDENIWLTQVKISELFGVDRSVVSKHLSNIFKEGELSKKATCANFAQVRIEADREVTRQIEFYNLDAIISVGYRVNSTRATHFRIWAISKQTAAEIIYTRANSEKQNMGLTNWKNSPDGPIRKPDVLIAKNYLNEGELNSLNRIVSMYLDFAEMQADNRKIMYMNDWIKKLDAFLQFNEKEIMDNPGKVSAEIAKVFAESEFEKYRVIQDRLYESDFDKEIKRIQHL